MRRALGVTVLCSLALACPRAGPEPPTPPGAADDRVPSQDEPTTAVAPSPRAPAQHAAAPNPTALKAAALESAQQAGLVGSSPGPGPELGVPVAGVKRIDGPWYPAPKLPPSASPYLVDSVDQLFSRAPWSTIEGNELVVRFSTRMPTEAAALYAGIAVEEDPIAAPRYRHYAPEIRKKPGRDHEVRIPMQGLLDPRTDVNHATDRGFGALEWLVEVYFPKSGSTILSEGRLAFRTAEDGALPLPTVVLGPLVHQVTERSAILSFETNVPTTATVGVGDRVLAHSRKPSTRHEVPVQGLSAFTEYPYAVSVSDGKDASLTPTRTLTTAGSPTLTVAILSDSRSDVGPGLAAAGGVNALVLRTLFAGAYRNGAQAVFFPGDLIDGYVAHVDDYDAQLRAWLRVVQSVHAELPVYTSMGNHEALVDVWNDGVVLDKPGDRSAEAHFAAIMVNPRGAPEAETADAPTYDETVYAWDIGRVHFVMLNTNYWYTRQPGHERHGGKGNREGTLMPRQLQWLDDDLAAARARGVDHIIVMGHEPAFPVAGHTKDAMWWNAVIPEVNAIRERFWKILAAHRVLAYVSGDEHNYSRALIGAETVAGAEASVFSVISGGCGAPYYGLDAPPQYADRVITFSAQQHYTLWTFEPDAAPRLRVYGITGGLIEDVRLDPG